MVKQKIGSPSCQLDGPHQSMGVHHPNSRAHTKVWNTMVKMSKKKCEKGWKWVKVGESPKGPYPPCGRSIKTYARGNNDAPSITKYGSLVRLDAQIVALCLHYARTALRAPAMSKLSGSQSVTHMTKQCPHFKQMIVVSHLHCERVQRSLGWIIYGYQLKKRVWVHYFHCLLCRLITMYFHM